MSARVFEAIVESRISHGSCSLIVFMDTAVGLGRRSGGVQMYIRTHIAYNYLLPVVKGKAYTILMFITTVAWWTRELRRLILSAITKMKIEHCFRASTNMILLVWVCIYMCLTGHQNYWRLWFVRQKSRRSRTPQRTAVAFAARGPQSFSDMYTRNRNHIL